MSFWDDPPWRDGRAPQHLGLRPIERSAWLVDDPALIHNKRRQLTDRYPHAVGVAPGAAEPNYAAWELPWSAVSQYPDWIANLGGGIAEDLCVLDVEDNLRLIAGVVAAPSYWRLPDKLGKSLWDVHQPVHGMNQRIGTNIDRFMHQVPLGQPFYRDNWFFHESSAYWSEPDVALLSQPISTWVIRSEQQVVYRPTPRYVLFTIRVVFAAMADLYRYPQTVAPLLHALGAMDTTEIEHFGGVDKHRLITEHVSGLANG